MRFRPNSPRLLLLALAVADVCAAACSGKIGGQSGTGDSGGGPSGTAGAGAGNPAGVGSSSGTAGGTLLDESLVLFTSENGDGDSHSRKNMPFLLAGHAGGFQTGRVVAATDKPTGALHASIIKRLGIDVSSYGNPAGSAIADL